MNTLVYVDKQLAVAIAVKLIGLLLGQSERERKGITLNWLIGGSISVDEAKSAVQDLREMLPEDIIYSIYEKIPHKFNNVEDTVRALAMSDENRILPGEVLTLPGQMTFPRVELPSSFDPFEPQDIDVDVFNFHGEKCFASKLVQGGFSLPTYFLESAKQEVVFSNEQPVEVTGIVRWSPPYSPGGAASLNLVIRVVALWLR